MTAGSPKADKGRSSEIISLVDYRIECDGEDLVLTSAEPSRRLQGFRRHAAVAKQFSRPSIDDDGAHDSEPLMAPAPLDPYGALVDTAYVTEPEIGRFLQANMHVRTRAGLRRIRVWADGEAANFPFEFASADDGQPLVLSPRLSLVRAVEPATKPSSRMDRSNHLVVAAVRSTTAPGLESLDLSDDVLAVSKAVSAAQANVGRDRISFESFDTPDLGELGATLRDIGEPTILVVSSHGATGAFGLGDRWVPVDEMVAALRGVDLRLVLLANCYSAVGGDGSSAVRLARSGIPLVIGMNDLAEHSLIRHFTQSLLESLLEGNTVDEAVLAGRQRIGDHVKLRQHGIPVLFTTVADRDAPVTVADATVFRIAVPALETEPSNEPLDPPLGQLAPPAARPALPREFPRHRYGRQVIRNKLIAAVETRIGGDDLVVVSGRRGGGKTHLARTVCARSRADLIWWVAAESEKAIARSLANLGRRLGLDAADADDTVDPGASADALGALACVRWLEETSHPWLLVLDNLDEPKVARGLIPRAPHGSTTLVTTIDGALFEENVLHMERLDLDESIEMLQLATGLVDRSGMEELVELIDRLPIAIYQAGSYISEHFVPLPDYVRRLRDNIGLLGDRVADVVCRIGLNELTPAQARFFRVLCQLDIDSLPQSLLRSPATAEALGMTDMDIDQVVRKIRRSGLAEADLELGALRIHRLTAKIALSDMSKP